MGAITHPTPPHSPRPRTAPQFEFFAVIQIIQATPKTHTSVMAILSPATENSSGPPRMIPVTKTQRTKARTILRDLDIVTPAPPARSPP